MNGFSAPEIEQAAISAMVQWEPCRDKGLAQLAEDHFHDSRCRRLFATLVQHQGKPIDLISFTHILRGKNLLDSIGADYVSQTFTNCCHSPLMMDFYIETLVTEQSKRLVLSTCGNVATSGLNGIENPVLDTISKLQEIPTYQPKKERTLSDLVEEKLIRMEQGKQDEGIIKTGIKRLDIDSPLWRSDMPLITGERKAGKSIFALSIAVNIAKQGIGVAYFSLEDNESKVIDRLLSGMSRVEQSKQHHVSNLNAEELSRSSKASLRIKELPFFIRDNLRELLEITSEIKELKARNDIGVAVIDYGQLVRTSIQKDRTREQEVSHVSRTFRLLAMELRIAIIVLSQLNEKGATRESKALEQDTTAAWHISNDDSNSSKRWIWIPFQRNGDSDIRFPVTFLGQYARVENYELEQPSQQS